MQVMCPGPETLAVQLGPFLLLPSKGILVAHMSVMRT